MLSEDIDTVAGDEALFAQIFSSKIASQTMKMHTQATGIFLFVSFTGRPVMIPVSTSPLPAVAIPLLPVLQKSIFRRGGRVQNNVPLI